MPSPTCEQAIRDAQRVGTALLKVISPNDVGLTGGHQKGYYLPRSPWAVYTLFPPTRGVNNDHSVEAIWQDGRTTQSTVKWYGKGTRYEYRLTGFNRETHFPFITTDCVGSLLVLVPERVDRFLMYVLDLEDDIEDLQAGLGVEVVRGWALYQRDAVPAIETESECIEKYFRQFSAALTTFPATLTFSNEARAALVACVQDFLTLPSDRLLLRCVEAEYELFKFAERRLCEPEIVRIFKTVDDFLATAQTILQRRKARAGKSLEHHVEFLLKQAAIPFDRHADVEGTKPDLLIPGKREYLDTAYPIDRLFAVGVKTTCKDRWRQVLREAPRVRSKHILTLQRGISPAQLDEMRDSAVTLIVPEGLHSNYPQARRAELLTVSTFIHKVRSVLAR
jgi:hypothetical protein